MKKEFKKKECEIRKGEGVWYQIKMVDKEGKVRKLIAREVREFRGDEDENGLM
jgi:hypothetical protein